MAKILTSENVNGVTETFEFDEAEQLVGVRHTQDVTPFLDHIAAANLEGVREIEGLGVQQYEIPLGVAIDWATKRGLPWEEFVYTNRHEAEWNRMCKAHPHLKYNPAKKLHPCR
jgi:YD repeat-containing protein